MLSHLGKGQANRFGIYFRHPLTSQNCRDTLSRSWSVENREDLIETITSMTFSGHNSSFLYDAALVNSLSAALPGRDKASIQAAIEACGLQPGVRGERLTLRDFAALAEALREKPGI